MIRRAQAEALLNLAEALEECERNGINLRLCDGSHAWLMAPGVSTYMISLSAIAFRYKIASLYPKSEEAE